MRYRRTRKNTQHTDIAPDEIFIDAKNLPKFDTDQFEGRIERPISNVTITLLLIFFLITTTVLVGRLWFLQINKGSSYLHLSENNRLSHSPIFSTRGIILDRNGVELAWNESYTYENTDTGKLSQDQFPLRRYIDTRGFAHILGYVNYPKKDENGFYYQEDTVGMDGVEKFYSAAIKGRSGLKITETDVHAKILSSTVIRTPESGKDINLSIDSRIQERFYEYMESVAQDIGFRGGAGVLVDISNGEILAMVSYPEYDPQILTDGVDTETIDGYVRSAQKPFLNRATAGIYTPGSTIKPFIAMGALHEEVVTPDTKIFSSGSISLPHPYDPELRSTFKDWKAHGWVNIKDALAVSSNVYFYEVGGGFEDQKGIGIAGIEKYARAFGIGEYTNIDVPHEERGVIPNPIWKEEHFPNDPWRVGDTYNTAIGQYGFQVTPIQMARGISAIANGGLLVTPHVLIGTSPPKQSNMKLKKEYVDVVKKGMRQAVLSGTAQGLNIPHVDIAAKTGTAELGTKKNRVNSWIIGFFPFNNPKYAFATVMESGPSENKIGALFVIRQLMEWMALETPEYL